jgi:hypothetical protein
MNEKVAKYEEALRAAERNIEQACQAICSLRGPFPHRELNDTLVVISELIRGAWRFYDNPEVEEA